MGDRMDAMFRPNGSWRQPQTHFVSALYDPWYRTVVTVQDVVFRATVDFWSRRSLRWLNLPITTTSISSPMGLGSDSSPVRIELDGQSTHLADSMQFLLEYGCRLSPGGCFYVMPSFRGEPPDETHLNQFFHSEAELPGDLEAVITGVEEYLAALCVGLLDECPDELSLTAGSVAHLERMAGEAGKFTRLTFEEAAEVLDDTPAAILDEGQWRTLTRLGERLLMERVAEFVWVTHWDHLSVPFYQAFDHTGRLAKNADLLFGPGEVVGAGERHEDGAAVAAALKLHEVEPAAYDWYQVMKDASPMVTSGFGLGVERFLAWAMRHDDIRDFQLVPRFAGMTHVP